MFDFTDIWETAFNDILFRSAGKCKRASDVEDGDAILLLLAIAQVYTGVLRGAGRSMAAMLLMVGSMVGIRMLWVGIMTSIIPKLSTVLWGYPVSWSAAALGVIIYMWRVDWLHLEKKKKNISA